MPEAYVALGANLGDPPRQIKRALARIAAIPGVDLLRCSPLYRSAPLGPPGQPDYCNAVCALHTVLAPLELLHALQAIETAAGRVRSERWGARVLDLDLLHVAGVEIATLELALPHPEMPVRNFVLIPLREIAPTLVVGRLGSVAELAERVGNAGLMRWP
jgi:2-amino-4-hydroxy-6-hydroxymethyldihydropteridine diphosphokinase